MREITAITIIAFAITTITACATFAWKTPTLPRGTIACSADYQCPTNYICGFNGVDQVPHCIYKPGESNSY